MGKATVQFDLREGRRSAQETSLYAKLNNEVEFAEKIVELLDSPELREKIGAKGRRRMEEVLEWQYQAQKLLEADQERQKVSINSPK